MRGKQVSVGSHAELFARSGGELWEVQEGYVTVLNGVETLHPTLVEAITFARALVTPPAIAAEQRQVLNTSHAATIDPQWPSDATAEGVPFWFRLLMALTFAPLVAFCINPVGTKRDFARRCVWPGYFLWLAGEAARSFLSKPPLDATADLMSAAVVNALVFGGVYWWLRAWEKRARRAEKRLRGYLSQPRPAAKDSPHAVEHELTADDVVAKLWRTGAEKARHEMGGPQSQYGKEIAGRELGSRSLHERAILAMKHKRWWDLEVDAQGRCASICVEPDASGNGTDVPLVRLVRLCDYLDNPSNREEMRKNLHSPRGRISLRLAAHAPKTMDSRGRCRRCFACSNALRIPVGLPEHWIDDAALASPYWLVNDKEAQQQSSLEAARETMRICEETGESTLSRLPKEGLLASAMRAAVSAGRYRLYIGFGDASFVPVSDEANRPKHMVRDLTKVVSGWREFRSSLTNALEKGLPRPQGGVREMAAAISRLMQDVDELMEEIEWARESQKKGNVKDQTVSEKVHATLFYDTVMSLETPLREYFEVMPSIGDSGEAVLYRAAGQEPEEMRTLNVTLRNLLKSIENLKEPPAADKDARKIDPDDLRSKSPSPIHGVDTPDLNAEERALAAAVADHLDRKAHENAMASPYYVFKAGALTQCPSLETAREAADLYGNASAEVPDYVTICVRIGEREVMPSEILPIDEFVSILTEDGGLLATLSPREEQILRMHFGIDRATSNTLEEIAEQTGLTQERVRELETKALRKLGRMGRIQELREQAREENQRFLAATADFKTSPEDRRAGLKGMAMFNAVLDVGHPVSRSRNIVNPLPAEFFQTIFLECAYRADLHHRYPTPQAGTISDPASRAKFLSDLRVKKPYRASVLTMMDICSRHCKTNRGWNLSALE